MKNTDFMNSNFLGMGESKEDWGRVQKGPQVYLKSISEKTKTWSELTVDKGKWWISTKSLSHSLVDFKSFEIAHPHNKQPLQIDKWGKKRRHIEKNVLFLVRIREIPGHFKFEIPFNVEMLLWQNLIPVTLGQLAGDGCIPYPFRGQIKCKI